MSRNQLSQKCRFSLTIDEIRYSDIYIEGDENEVLEKGIEILKNRLKENDVERDFDDDEREVLEECFSIINTEK